MTYLDHRNPHFDTGSLLLAGRSVWTPGSVGIPAKFARLLCWFTQQHPFVSQRVRGCLLGLSFVVLLCERPVLLSTVGRLICRFVRGVIGFWILR